MSFKLQNVLRRLGKIEAQRERDFSPVERAARLLTLVCAVERGRPLRPEHARIAELLGIGEPLA